MKFLWEKDMVESSNMAVLQCTAARGWRFNVSDVLFFYIFVKEVMFLSRCIYWLFCL